MPRAGQQQAQKTGVQAEGLNGFQGEGPCFGHVMTYDPCDVVLIPKALKSVLTRRNPQTSRTA